MQDKLIELKNLCDLFTQNFEQYKSSKYDEANTRTQFIDRFFELLDWDIANKLGFSENYKDVVREDKVIIEGKPKAPDYSFRVGGVRKFFLEAKKPSVNIKDEIEPAYQVRRYGFTAKLPLCILTDFEEFAVYDTRIKPEKSDKASVARVFYCTYNEYEKHFEFIYNTFSKGAILKGSFDKYIVDNKKKKGTSEVDKEFLSLIETWREMLAKSIAIRNKDLDIYSLNTAVQILIDRLIFLRIAEDRNMEKYGMLLEACNDGVKNRSNIPTYSYINEIFLKANKKYNSGLFKPEDWISHLVIDDKIFQSIIRNLYYPDSPYEFSVLPIEILGNIYEQFLGKTIRLTASHQAKVEEKEEVRKAGGVYYTPKYIVDYIVENTIGQKLKDIDLYIHPKLRVLDPACGSGSFLVGAYSYLLDKYLETYTSKKHLDKSLKNGLIYNVTENTYRLSITVKQHILLNHIFGVDIDHQAVEVTKLSLLLKLMEDENTESVEYLFKESRGGSRATLTTILPDLSNNIKCGNSLIGSDFYSDKDLNLFGKEELRKVNVFDWEKEFVEVFLGNSQDRSSCGFDCVIGNPPWIDIKGFEPVFVRYIFNKYQTTENRMNVYSTFIEKSFKLLKKGNKDNFSFLGFITPNSYLTQSSYRKLRSYILDNYKIAKLIRLPDNTFKNVKAESLITIFETYQKTNDGNVEIIIFDRNQTINSILKNESKVFKKENQKTWRQSKDQIISIQLNKENRVLIEKIEKDKVQLITLCDFSLGITPYDKYKGHLQKDIQSRNFHSTEKKDATYKPILEGSNISRYAISNNVKEYIRYGTWLGAPREERFFTKPRILVRQIISGNPGKIFAGYTEEELYNAQIAFNILLKEDAKYSIKFILGIINSKLISFYHREKYLDPEKNVFQKILIQDCKNFPISKLDLSNKKDKSLHGKMILLVEQMISTQKQIHNSKTQADKELCKKKSELLDNQIDRLVYELYGLNEEEIKIVEGN